MPLTELLAFYKGQGVGTAVICNDFNYYTVGNYTIVNRADFNKNWQNYFTERQPETAVDSFSKSQQELEYIQLMEKNTRQKVVCVSQARTLKNVRKN